MEWHAEKQSCVRSKRRRMYRQHVYMCKLMWVWCRYTRGRFEHTDGEREKKVIVSSEYSKTAHVGLSRAPEVQQRTPWILPIFCLRIGREQHVAESSNHSLHLNTLFNSRHMTQRHTHRHSTTEHNTAQQSTEQHSTIQHNNAQHNTAHSTARHTEAKRREEEVKETKRYRDEKRYK